MNAPSKMETRPRSISPSKIQSTNREDSPHKRLKVDSSEKEALTHLPTTSTRLPSTSFISHTESREKAYAVAQKIKQFLATRATFQKTLDINDVKQRYILVRESTRKEIKASTGIPSSLESDTLEIGADVQVLGKWVPLREYATEKEPTLMLRVTADTQEKLDAALQKLDELMGLAEKIQKLTLSTMSLGGRFIDARVDVGMEEVSGFNMRGKIVGPNGSYLRHVTSESGVRVQLKGRGSGFLEGDGKESDQPMYMHLTAQSNEEIAKGKKLCEDLLKSVKVEHELFMEQKRALEPMMGSMLGMGQGMGMGMPMAPPGMQDEMMPPPPGSSYF